MRALIYEFHLALECIECSMATLRDAKVARNREGGIETYRTKNYAHAQIEWRGARHIISLPLDKAASEQSEWVANRLKVITSNNIGSYQLLKREMLYNDRDAMADFADIILEQIPSGERLIDCIDTLDGTTLANALDELEAEMRRLKIIHRNITPYNIIVDSNQRLHLIMLHYAQRLTEYPAQSELLQIREWVLQRKGILTSDKSSQQAANRIDAQPTNDRYVWRSNPFEGLTLVQSESGYGYIDNEGHEVIPTSFLWANDFKEGRAEVETQSGMGLIDYNGEYIINPIYEIVEFDSTSGTSMVRSNNKWLCFDYMGREIEQPQTANL